MRETILYIVLLVIGVPLALLGWHMWRHGR